MSIKTNDTYEIKIIIIKAFDDAIAELDTLNEDSYKDSTLIMQVWPLTYTFSTCII